MTAQYLPISHQPHPDVAVVQSVLSQLTPGAVQPYAVSAAAISLSPGDPVYRRRAKAARDNLRRAGVNIVAVPGQGFLRETAEQTLARCGGRERKGIQKKSRKVGESLSGVDAAALKPEQRAEFFAERTINNVIFKACSMPARQKMLGAVITSQSVLPMAKAIEVLGSNGNSEANGKE